jgi:tRNA dimethylallyltransferase
MKQEKLVVILGTYGHRQKPDRVSCWLRKVGGEIISGDSMLVYREMNIGTAKPTAGGTGS